MEYHSLRKGKKEETVLHLLSGDKVCWKGLATISKNDIALKLNRTSTDFFLIRSGEVCEDALGGSETFIVTKTKQSSLLKTFPVKVKMPHRDAFILGVHIQDRVAKLRIDVCSKLDFDVSSVRMICGGKVLDDSYLIGDYLGILHQKSIGIVKTSTPNVNLEIEFPLGLKRICLEVPRRSLVSDLRKTLSEMVSVPLPRRQWVFYKGEVELDDHESFMKFSEDSFSLQVELQKARYEPFSRVYRRGRMDKKKEHLNEESAKKSPKNEMFAGLRKGFFSGEREKPNKKVEKLICAEENCKKTISKVEQSYRRCSCKKVYCNSHMHEHECSYDFKGKGKADLEKELYSNREEWESKF